MTGWSVLTLARGRERHLDNLVEGLRRSETPPDELVIVDMNDAPTPTPSADFPVRLVPLAGERLPLAAARNLAARTATGRRLMFLDADCIPSKALLGAMGRALGERDGLACPEVLYLPDDAARGAWDEDGLMASGRPHEARRFPAAGLRAEANAGLFWSLAFAVRRETFEALGGFDESFVGYGAEDTDFGFRAREAGLPLLFVGGAVAFHQHHPTSDPPVEHLADIVRNAEVFRLKWERLPMEGWLHAFEALGLIEIDANGVRLADAAGPAADRKSLATALR